MRVHTVFAACLVAMSVWLPWSVRAQSTGREVIQAQLRAAQPATLAEIFARNPRDPNAAMEVEVNETWYRIEAMLTGKQRKVDPAVGPLIRAWGGGQGNKGELAEEMASGAFPVLELEENGRKYWMLAGFLAAASLTGEMKPQKMVLFVQNLGFVAGEPIPQVVVLGKPEDAARLLAPPDIQKQ